MWADRPHSCLSVCLFVCNWLPNTHPYRKCEMKTTICPPLGRFLVRSLTWIWMKIAIYFSQYCGISEYYECIQCSTTPFSWRCSKDTFYKINIGCGLIVTWQYSCKSWEIFMCIMEKHFTYTSSSSWKLEFSAHTKPIIFLVITQAITLVLVFVHTLRMQTSMNISVKLGLTLKLWKQAGVTTADLSSCGL